MAVFMETNQLSKPTVTQEFNPIALRKAKIVCNFGLSECNRVIKNYNFIIEGISLVRWKSGILDLFPLWCDKI